MRQLILVEDFTTPSAVLAARLAAADLPATPVVVYDARGALEPAPSAQGANPVETLAEPPAEAFSVPGRDGLVVVAAHHGGRFPERLGERSRALFTTCDTLVARCPARDVVTAANLYSPFLYALDGKLDPANLRSATAQLLGLVDRARNSAARDRHDRLDDIPAEPFRLPVGEALRLSNLAADDDAVTRATIFETAYGELPVEMARLGFEMAARKVRESRSAVAILVGAPGIAVYGPYVALEEGDYRYRVELAGGGRDVAFSLEAAWNAGGQVLALHRYAATAADRVFADLAFSIAGPAVGRALELRLWNDEASAPFDLVRLSLVKVSPPW